MSELSKQALKVENNTSFPNNNNGEISAADLRGFNVNMIDSLVDEIGYNIDSASWNQQIDALEQFTSSQQPSFTALNQFTASQLTINSGVNTFTQSANGRLNNLEAYTASFTTSVGIYDEGTFVNNVNQINFNGNGITASFVSGQASVTVDFSKLNSATASLQAQLATIGGQSGSWITESETGSFVSSAITASSLITASFNNGTRNLTFTKGDNTTFNVNIPDVSGSAGDFVTTSSFNAYTASTTADLDSIHQTTQSLNNFTASLTTAFVSTASFNAYTASTNQRVSSLESNSASVNTSITNINTTTASLLIETQNLETFSASALVSISNLNQSSASQQVSINALNSATASYVTETESGSFLITASFDNGTRNLTFTKGNTTTFAVNIPDASGSAGDFVTTSSFNAYTSSNDQRVSSLQVNSASVNTSITNLNSFSSSQLTQNSNLGTYTGSVNTSITNINTTTASLNTSASLALVTASLSGNTITFTKGNGTTFNFTIPDVSGSTINTASFATTGSNSFIGNQNVAGRVIISGSSVLTNNNYLMFTRDGGGDIFRVGVSDNGQTYDFVVTGSTNQQLWLIDNQGGTYINTFQAPIIAAGNVRLEAGFTASLQEGYAWVGNATNKNAQVPTSSFGGGSVPAGTISSSAQITALGFVSSSVTASSLITASVSLNTITFTKGDNTTFNITVDTGSGGGGGGGQTFANPSVESISGSLVLSALTFNSGAANLLHLSASAQNQANLVFKNNNLTSSTQVSGSNNIFVNPTAPTANFARFVGGFGNIYMNSGSVPQITASAASVSGSRPTMNNNIIPSSITWNINQASNPGTHTYSNNILENGTLNFNTTGNTGAVTFSNNIGLSPTVTLNAPSASVANVLAGVSGSNVVSIQSNIIQGTITYQGPVSSSQHTISQNNIAGTLTMNVQSGSRGYTVSNNTTNGTLTINDNTVSAPTLAITNAFQQNNINGTITLTNRASASISITGNTLNGFTITNDFDASTNGTNGRTFVLQGNSIFGAIGNNIYFSGSAAGANSANERGRGLYSNLIGGNRISASVIGDGNRHLIASAIVGHGLNIYGTSLYDASNAANAGGQNGGSAFFGRWNAEDGNRALSAETVFAVGTGNSGSAGITRKTGFLIDSGSNTFIEGTLNVSGSTTITGSLILSSSAATELIVIGESQFSGSVKVAPTFQLQLPTGSNQQAGTAVLDGANPGTITVSNSLVTANSIIMVSKQTLAHPSGYVAVSAKSAGSFTITSNHNGDTDTVGWFVINNS